ncbi:hypothetical protein [Desulfomarina sp.]
MADEKQDQSGGVGLAALPKNWSVAVQLVGTFGLAVFLVLYYVLVMQPRDIRRYEELRDSILSLEKIMIGRQSLVTRETVRQLEDLYIAGVGYETGSFVKKELEKNVNSADLAKEIEKKLIFETRLLEGLRKKDEGVVSEMLTYKILDSGISDEIAKKAVREWRGKTLEEIVAECRNALYFAIRRAARAK